MRGLLPFGLCRGAARRVSRRPRGGKRRWWGFEGVWLADGRETLRVAAGLGAVCVGSEGGALDEESIPVTSLTFAGRPPESEGASEGQDGRIRGDRGCPRRYVDHAG